MGKVLTQNIRNVALLGHGGDGKTSIAEAALFFTKATDRLGKTTEGNTVCDYDAEEIKRGFSLSAALAPVTRGDVKINFIDTPGYLGFAGEALQGIRVAGAALIVLDAKSGVEVGTELAWDRATDAGIPKAFFINKFDDKEANFAKVFTELKDKFGMSVCPMIIPYQSNCNVFIDLVTMKALEYDANGNAKVGEIPAEHVEYAKRYHSILLESIAETSEELMEKFFAEEEITEEEAANAVKEGLMSGSIAPVICGSALKLWGISDLLDIIAESFPTPISRQRERVVIDDEIKRQEITPDGTTSIFIFKTVSDPFVGKMSFFKVMNGELRRDMTLKNMQTGAEEKMAHFYVMKGKKQTEVDTLCCGDIGMIPKLSNTNTNDTLSIENVPPYAGTVYPVPVYTMAVSPKAKGDEDKISSGINKLLEEDNTLIYENNKETKQILISGLGDIHLDVVVSRLKTRYNTSVELSKPKIAYRESIKKKAQAEGKHKKQSGGSGQYGHVKITFSPGEADGLTFTQSVVGGSVPKNYYPAVEKGLLEAMQKGVLAGFPMVNLAADLYDGSYHPVDSNEISFKLAAILAYKNGMAQANPVILEPVGELKVVVPSDIMGDIIGDINKRRGRVLGMNADERKKSYSIVEAEVPKAEMTDYTIALRAMTGGMGKYTFNFVRYEEVPGNIAQKIIEEAKKNSEE